MISDSTCWTLVRGAAAGVADDREALATRYRPLVVAYLRKRWSPGRLAAEVDDAAQEVFVELFRADGALSRFDSEKSERFRNFLFAVIRNVARRFEERHEVRGRVRAVGSAIQRFVAEEEQLSRVYDLLWVRALLRQALDAYRDRLPGDVEARRRVEVLELRVVDGRPIRDIAREWNVDPAYLHRAYRIARGEFRTILLEIVSFQTNGTPGEVERELRHLAASLRS